MLIVDNYDSFTYNIVQYIKILGIEPVVIKNDELTLSEIKKLNFKRIILSPGWGNPENSGITMDVIDFYKNRCPILGVCLGMQCIAKYFGAEIVKAPEPFHGKNSKIFFDKDFKIFENLKQGFSATRYHSLIIHPTPCPLPQGAGDKASHFEEHKAYKNNSLDLLLCSDRNDDLPPCVAPQGAGVNASLTPTLFSEEGEKIQIKAWTEDKIPMGLNVKDKEIYGVQFHPEAILTENGIEIFKNFISIP